MSEKEQWILKRASNGKYILLAGSKYGNYGLTEFSSNATVLSQYLCDLTNFNSIQIFLSNVDNNGYVDISDVQRYKECYLNNIKQ